MTDPTKRRLPLVGSGTGTGNAHPEPTPAPKRRLPVLQGSGGDDEGEERPPLHWIGFGTVAIFLVWLPLSGIVNTLLRRLLEDASGSDVPARVRVSVVGLNVLAFVLAGGAGGVLVGRFGGRAGEREAAASGLCVAALAWVLAVTQDATAGVFGWALLLLVMLAIGGGASYVGGRIGVRLRHRGGKPLP